MGGQCPDIRTARRGRRREQRPGGGCDSQWRNFWKFQRVLINGTGGRRPRPLSTTSVTSFQDLRHGPTRPIYFGPATKKKAFSNFPRVLSELHSTHASGLRTRIDTLAKGFVREILRVKYGVNSGHFSRLKRCSRAINRYLFLFSILSR